MSVGQRLTRGHQFAISEEAGRGDREGPRLESRCWSDVLGPACPPAQLSPGTTCVPASVLAQHGSWSGSATSQRGGLGRGPLGASVSFSARRASLGGWEEERGAGLQAPRGRSAQEGLAAQSLRMCRGWPGAWSVRVASAVCFVCLPAPRKMFLF